MKPPSAVPAAPDAVSPARQIAFRAVRLLDDAQAPHLDDLVDGEADRLGCSPEDRALARELSFGFARRRMWLSKILDGFLEKPLPVQHTAARDAILLGIYQHVFLERIPGFAIVNETVNQVAAQPGGHKVRGLANAILRRVVGKPRESLLPRPGDDPKIVNSIPEWLESESRGVLPVSELAAFYNSTGRPAALCLRPVGEARKDVEGWWNRLQTELREQFGGGALARKGVLVPECAVVEGAGAVDRLPLFREGLCTVEDEGAQVAGWLAGAGATGRILDVCAAPGGKTAHLCDLAAPDSEIHATDISEKRLSLLRETLERLGMAGRVSVSLTSDFLKTARPGQFDLVLVDAPCSALGTLRRHPEIRYRGSREEIERLSAVQRILLGKAARLVRNGGVLVYSICTFAATEAENTIHAFMGKNPEYRPADAPEGLPFDAAPLEVRPGIWRTWPHRNGCDGFTIVRLRRGGE